MKPSSERGPPCDGLPSASKTEVPDDWLLRPGVQKCRKPFTIVMEADLMQRALFLVALVTRLWQIDYPRAIVFDEVHFGRFASMYLQGTFFFDVHPPLAKLLLALSAYTAGFDADFNFDKIGTEYKSSVPVLAMRLAPAMFGSFLVPVVYQIIIDLKFSQWIATLAASLIIIDNALLVQSRFMLLDGFLLFFVCSAIMSYLKFKKLSISSPFSMWWWIWLFLLSVSTGLCIVTKYTGCFTVALVWILCVRDYWRMIADKSQTSVQLMKHLVSRVGCLLGIPVIIYGVIFYVHLALLVKAGPHDSAMTSAFQASLEGGLAAITKGQPLDIAYGSQVTLRRTYGQPCWLHSHQHVYPVRYPDNRGSSHQQQVTCYSFKDINNWWIIKDPSRNTLVVDDPMRPIKDGDVVQLVHGMTSRALNSHDVAAPVSPQHQEVSCYIDYNISIPAQNLWRVEIVNTEEVGNSWQTIRSQVQLIHVNTSQALKVTGKHLPDWGFHQLEVVTDRIINQEAAVWNVEEHRYTRSPDEEEREKDLKKAEMIPLNPTKLSFLAKFWELQVKMWTSQHDAELEHKYSSSPLEWPLLDRNVAYWVHANHSAQIHLIGNPALWWSGTLSLMVYGGLLLFYVLRRRRKCEDIERDLWEQFVETAEICFAGFLINFIPFFLTERTLFLHHYLPALIFKVMTLTVLVGHMTQLAWGQVPRMVVSMAVIVWFTFVFNTFLSFSVFTYGTQPVDDPTLRSLRWRDSWDFIHVESPKR